jgi:two-component system sensor histidine kinase KdpD
MLREAQQLMRQGTDVVVAFVETYERPLTTEALGSLEIVPRKSVLYRNVTLEDMDRDAVLQRRPQVALVDELAHTNVPGLKNEKRWQDIQDILAAGIDVISTMNIQHLESVKDTVERIAGVPVRETVPDRVLDEADELQFIDIAPEALRKRMRHGNIYPTGRAEAALANFFRPGNLAALREIGLRVMADSMASLHAVRSEPEDVLIAVSCRESSEGLIRRGARLARRLGGVCMVVTISPESSAAAERYAQLANQLGCSFVTLAGADVAAEVIRAARQAGVKHVVLGEALDTGWLGRFRPTLVDLVIDGLPMVDIHVVARVCQ